MTEKIIDKFRSCVVGNTYYVEGHTKGGKDISKKYWYLFTCIENDGRTIYGSDLADWKNKKSQNWSMELVVDNNVNSINGGITKLESMSVNQLKETRPEYFL